MIAETFTWISRILRRSRSADQSLSPWNRNGSSHRDPSREEKVQRLHPNRFVEISRYLSSLLSFLTLFHPQKPATSKTSQKAFRERRQEYVVELEEKVRQLEAGEGEKCVFYQQQAQRAKAESTAFKSENDQLKREIDKLRREVEAFKSGGGGGGPTKGKARALPVEFEEEDPNTTSKRPRRSAAVRAQAVVAAASDRSSPIPSGSNSSAASRRISNASQASNHPSPATSTSSNSPPAYPLHQSAPVFAHSPLHETHPASPASHDSHSSHPHPPPSHLNSSNPHSGSCGFCASASDCLCREMGYQYASSSATPSNQQLPSALSNVASPQQLQEDVPFANETSYEPAVPLRLGSNRSKVQSVWRIDPPKQIRTKFDTVVAVAEKVLCSGDPSNCPACSDDP